MRTARRPWARRIAVFMALSALLHMLATWLLQPPPPKEQARAFYAPHDTFFAPFRPYVAQRPSMPRAQMQRLDPAQTPDLKPLDFALAVPTPPIFALKLPDSNRADMPLVFDKRLLQSKKLVLPNLGQLFLDGERRRIAEREHYARPFRYDADTTDAESQSRRRAREIVERAIRVMGGQRLLASITEMRARVWIEAWENVDEFPPPRRVYNVGTYAYPIVEWHYSGFDSFSSRPIQIKTSFDPDVPYPLYLHLNPAITRSRYTRLFEHRWLFFGEKARQLRLDGEAARWHFLDRFLGEGIIIHYLGTEEFAKQPAFIVRVDDRRYGHYLDAFFAQASGLLLGVRESLTPTEAQRYRSKYQQAIPVWTTTYSKYRRVNGLLTPHRFTRSGPYRPQRFGRDTPTVQVSIQLQIAYNGQQPTAEPPDLEYWVP